MRDKQQTNERTLKIELLSQWKLEAEFRNKRSVDQEGRRQGWYWSMRSSLTGAQREGGEGQNKLLLLCPRRDFSKKCWNQTNTAHHSPLCLPSSLNPCQDPFETYLLHSPLNWDQTFFFFFYSGFYVLDWIRVSRWDFLFNFPFKVCHVCAGCNFSSTEQERDMTVDWVFALVVPL